MAVTWTATANPASVASATTSTTFVAQSLGSAAGDRVTVVRVDSQSFVVTSVTVGGLSATKAIEESSTISGCQIWYVDTHGLTTTEDIILNFGAGNSATNVTIQVGRLTGVDVVPTTTASAAPGAADPSTITATVPTGGIGIVGMTVAGNITGTWSNATRDFHTVANPSNIDIELAHTSTAGSQTPSYASLGGNSSHSVMACWQPTTDTLTAQIQL